MKGGGLRGRAVLGAIAALVAVGALLSATGLVRISGEALLSLAIAGTGVSLGLCARRGRGAGLVFVGVVASLAMLGAAAAPVPGQVKVRARFGERIERPLEPADAADGYDLEMGSLVLDLTQLRLGPALTVVRAHVGVGRIAVRVLEGSRTSVHANLRAGRLEAFGRQVGSGIGVVESVASAGSLGHRLVLELTVGLGDISVDFDRVPAVPAAQSIPGRR